MSDNNAIVDGLKLAFKKQNVADYRIIKHTVHQILFSFYADRETKEEREKTMFHIFFTHDNVTYYLCLPPCTENVFEHIILRIIKNKSYYFSDSLAPVHNSIQVDIKNKSEKIITEDYIKDYLATISKERDEFRQAELHNLDFSSHELVEHKQEIYVNERKYTQSVLHNYIMLKVTNEHGVQSVYADEVKHGRGMYITLLNESIPLKFELMSHRLNGISGIVCFPAEHFKMLFHFLMESLNGKLVSENRSFIKRESINTKILREEISIIFNPSTENTLFDAEGTKLSYRTIIHCGSLQTCVNNLRSAALLNQEAGNTQYNYLTNENIISHNYIDFVYSQQEAKNHNVEFTVTKIFDGLNFNIENGIVDFSFETIDKKNHLHAHRVKISITDFHNKIIKAKDDCKNVGVYKLPSVILEF